MSAIFLQDFLSYLSSFFRASTRHPFCGREYLRAHSRAVCQCSFKFRSRPFCSVTNAVNMFKSHWGWFIFRMRILVLCPALSCNVVRTKRQTRKGLFDYIFVPSLLVFWRSISKRLSGLSCRLFFIFFIHHFYSTALINSFYPLSSYSNSVFVSVPRQFLVERLKSASQCTSISKTKECFVNPLLSEFPLKKTLIIP